MCLGKATIKEKNIRKLVKKEKEKSNLNSTFIYLRKLTERVSSVADKDIVSLDYIRICKK